MGWSNLCFAWQLVLEGLGGAALSLEPEAESPGIDQKFCLKAHTSV